MRAERHIRATDDRWQSLGFLVVVGATTLGVDAAGALDLVSLPVVAIGASMLGLVAISLGSVALAEVRR